MEATHFSKVYSYTWREKKKKQKKPKVKEKENENENEIPTRESLQPPAQEKNKRQAMQTGYHNQLEV